MRLIWMTGVLSAALFAGLAWYLRDLDPGVLALQFASTPRGFGWVIHSWSPDQLARYRQHFAGDAVLLMSYGSFGWLLARRTQLFSGWSAQGQLLARWTMPLAALADAVEDLLHLWLTEVPRFGVPLPYALATGAAALKWLLLLLFCSLVLRALWPTRPAADSTGGRL